MRHRLEVILGLAVCAVLAGARSFTAIAEWSADAGRETRRMLGATGVVPSESTFRRTLQRLDADAFDERAGGWAAHRTTPGREVGGSSRSTARLYAAQPAPASLVIICWLLSIMPMAPSWAAKTNGIPTAAAHVRRVRARPATGRSAAPASLVHDR